MKPYKIWFIVLAVITAISILLSGYLVTHQPEQCPGGLSYEEAVQQTGGCIIGADIGTGLGIIMLGGVVLFVAFVVAVHIVVDQYMLAKARRPPGYKPSKNMRVLKVTTIATVSIIFAFVVLSVIYSLLDQY